LKQLESVTAKKVAADLVGLDSRWALVLPREFHPRRPTTDPVFESLTDVKSLTTQNLVALVLASPNPSRILKSITPDQIQALYTTALASGSNPLLEHLLASSSTLMDAVSKNQVPLLAHLSTHPSPTAMKIMLQKLPLPDSLVPLYMTIIAGLETDKAELYGTMMKRNARATIPLLIPATLQILDDPGMERLVDGMGLAKYKHSLKKLVGPLLFALIQQRQDKAAKTVMGVCGEFELNAVMAQLDGEGKTRFKLVYDDYEKDRYRGKI
jgi:hypothetical protein